MSDPTPPAEPSHEDGGRPESPPPPPWRVPGPDAPQEHLYGPPPHHEPTRPLEIPPPPPPGPPPPGPGGWGQPPAYAGQHPPPYGYGFGPVTNQKAAWALGVGVASIVLGCCVALLGFGGIAAIVLGAQARKEIVASGGRQSGDGLAIAGIVTGVVAVVVGAIFGLYLVLTFGSLALGGV